MRDQRFAAPWWTQAILYISLLVLFFPLALLCGSSAFNFGSFREALLDPDLSRALSYSFLVAASSSFIATVLGLAASLSLGRNLQRMAKLSLLIPEIVFSLSLLSWFAILRFELGLVTVILSHATFSLAYALFTISARLAIIDSNIVEAARDLGASEWQIQRDILIPLLWPAIAAAYLLCLILSFDDFLIAFFTSGVGSETLPVKVYTSLRAGMSPKLNALATLVFLGTSLVALIIYRLLLRPAKNSP